MQAAFQQAAFPKPFKVLGKKLHPYTLGHDILLGAFESGFCRDVRTKPTFDDLLISVWICSHDTHEKATRSFLRPFAKFRIWLWGKLCGKFDIGEAFVSFGEYIAEHTTEPEYWIEKHSDSGGAPSGNPYSQFLKVVMMRDLGMTEQQALDTSYSAAEMGFLTTLESAGKIRMFSDSDREAVRGVNDPEQRKKLEEWARKAAVPCS